MSLRATALFPVFAASLLFAGVASAEVLLSGTLQKWQPLTLDLIEPSQSTTELSDNPNPFLDIALSVTFTAPSGNTTVVPGFYAGDGNGGSEGATWRVRFAPDETGFWEYTVSFISGEDIAVAEDLSSALALPQNGEGGSFTISGIPADAKGFTRTGRLEYVGEHYLKFADGDYWIKGGVDSPENFFGFAGFDNTVDQPQGAGSTGLNLGVHQYEPHVVDWQEGDPDFSNSATGFSGKGIIGAVNYLASEGVNSIYFLPMNLGGDGRETYPFVGPSASVFDKTHYDVSKLRQWNMVLEHMQNKGIAAHIVLAETEFLNTHWLDNAGLGVERKLFFRELVARFSYLLALKWNLSEESAFGDARHKRFAKYIREIDWARHQLTVHTNKDQVAQRYDTLLGEPDFDTSSIQFSVANADMFVEEWRKKTAAAGKRWVIDMDEIDPAHVGLTDSNAEELRAKVLYPVYFSGGNIEWYFGYHELPLGGDIRTENFRTREPMFRYMRIAREFMHNELPFTRMEPDDSLHSLGDSSGIQVFAEAGRVYAVYLPDGQVGGSVTVADGTYNVRWFNPVTGEFVGEMQQLTGFSIEHGMPPDDSSQDWVVLLRNRNIEQPVTATPDPGTPAPVVGEGPDDKDTTTGTDTDANGGTPTTDTPALGEAGGSVEKSGGSIGMLWGLLLGFACFRRIRSASHAATKIRKFHKGFRRQPGFPVLWR